MEGRLGAIYIGKKQVGGFLDWHVKLNLNEGVDGDDKTTKLASWKVVTWAHWLTQILEPGVKIRLKLCSDAGYGYWECNGKVNTQPTRTLGTLIHVRLDFIGSGDLEGKETPHE